MIGVNFRLSPSTTIKLSNCAIQIKHLGLTEFLHISSKNAYLSSLEFCPKFLSFMTLEFGKVHKGAINLIDDHNITSIDPLCNLSLFQRYFHGLRSSELPFFIPQPTEETRQTVASNKHNVKIYISRINLIAPFHRQECERELQICKCRTNKPSRSSNVPGYFPYLPFLTQFVVGSLNNSG